MSQHRELFERVRAHTGMYMLEETYASAAAFVMGYDLACEGGVCDGFREWLLVRIDDADANNFAWLGLVPRVAFPASRTPQTDVLASAETQRHAINTLFSLLAEYDEVISKPDGRREVFAAYERWLRRHKRR
jgi:hypothetical protein